MNKRKFINIIMLIACSFCALVGILSLFVLLFNLIVKGLSHINLSIFLNDPTPPGISGGGLKCAFIGQGLIILVAIILGVPAGILAGTYLSEYGKDSKLFQIIRILSEIMISIPAIVVGSFIYAVIVKPLGHFSGYAGGISLAIIMFPIVVKTTDEILKLVPDELREAGFAIGATKTRVIIDIVYRSAVYGIFTGVLLGIARVAGEAAPLLFTSFNNSFTTLNLNEPVSSLTVTIFQYAMGPFKEWHNLAWASSLLITFFILGITVISRLTLKWRLKK